MVKQSYGRTRFACYFTYIASASIFTLPALLLITFREMYNISYTLLGSLVLVNFITQLGIDLLFSFFTRFFNIKKTVRSMPALTSLGLFIYALSPIVFKGNEYIGLLIGTVIFSVSAGLGEVLISPIIAAIPSDNPDRDMSLLHSIYAWGVLFVIIISTLFFNIFGSQNWVYLTMFFAALPLITCVLFCTSPIPDVSLGHNTTGSTAKKRNTGIALCFLCIFLGGATEGVMTNWVSGYLENALKISKTLGDIFGMAMFALFLGFGRILYAKYGRNIIKVLMFSMLSCVVCYLTAGLCTNAVIVLVACVATGLCSSMLWPGTLILLEERIPCPGVAAYALMAAGGDLGCALAPQLMGIVVDNVAINKWAMQLGEKIMISSEQIGMKTGMLITALFPVVGFVLIVFMKKYFDKKTY